MSIPVWALSLAYWLHMLATVVWIGALVTLALVVLPAAQRSLTAQANADLIGQIQRRIDPLAWFSLLVLAGTGMLQMSVNPNYQGFLAVENPWAVAIFIKHMVFLVMVAASIYMTWGVLPQLRRLALRQARSQSAETTPQVNKWTRREVWILRINLALGVIVLGMTALARAS
jgi:uncharacterized membrane protein